MAISGCVQLEETQISFISGPNNTVTFTVELHDEFGIQESETFTVPQYKFFKALAIAVHNDGMPEWEKDYPDAESIQGKIRWIP